MGRPDAVRLSPPGLTGPERRRVRRLQRKLARARRGSNRRSQVKHAIARLRARERDRRKDWAEKASTGIARRFDLMDGVVGSKLATTVMLAGLGSGEGADNAAPN